MKEREGEGGKEGVGGDWGRERGGGSEARERERERGERKRVREERESDGRERERIGLVDGVGWVELLRLCVCVCVCVCVAGAARWAGQTVTLTSRWAGRRKAKTCGPERGVGRGERGRGRNPAPPQLLPSSLTPISRCGGVVVT